MAKKSTANKILKGTSLSIGAKLVLAVLITAILGISLLFSDYIITNILGYEPAGGAKIVSYDELNVHFVDVGQGDSTIVEFPDGKTMIVDGGENKKEVADKITGYIDSYLDIKYFDYAVVTHTDSDHLGSMDAVLAAYPAKTVYRPNVISAHESSARGKYDDIAVGLTADPAVTDPNVKLWGGAEVLEVTTPVYRDFLEQAYKDFVIDGATVSPTVIVSDGRRDSARAGKPSQDIFGADSAGVEYSVKFYAPTQAAYKSGGKIAPNDYSNILIIEYGGFKVLLSGDAEQEAEKVFADTYKDIVFNVDVIKAGHHGSKTSSNKYFLEAVVSDTARRKDVFIAVSCENSNYGHPHKETLDRYTELGFSLDNLKNTDEIGDYRFSVKRDEAGEFRLYFNGESMRGVIRVSWYAIAGGLWVTSMTVIFFVVKTKKPTAQKPTAQKSTAKKKKG